MFTNTTDDEAKATITLPGTVEKIIPAIEGVKPEQAQINVEGADSLYRELRVDNVLQDGSGDQVSLKRGAHVEVTLAADPEGTQPVHKTPKI